MGISCKVGNSDLLDETTDQFVSGGGRWDQPSTICGQKLNEGRCGVLHGAAPEYAGVTRYDIRFRTLTSPLVRSAITQMAPSRMNFSHLSL